jgi:hypothetical protein
LPPELDRLSGPLVVGLTISPEPLVQIRMNRLRQLHLENQRRTSAAFEGDYAELERVRAELIYARRLFARHGWPVIDVTRRSVEETAAAIFQLLHARQGFRLPPGDSREGRA